MQLPPSPLVSAIVKHYLVIKNYSDIKSNYRLFSDGNPGIVFHLKDPLQSAGNGSEPSIQPRTFIYGQLTRFNNIISGSELHMLIVVLQPYAIYSLLRLSAKELNDTIIKLRDVFPVQAGELEEKVLSSRHIYGAIEVVEEFLLKRQATFSQPDPTVRMALGLINQHRGMISVEKLLDMLPITERQLERKFNFQIGLTPKTFAGTIKFHHFLKRLQKRSDRGNITDIIYDSGYYDQAHLNKSFKKYVGITPLQYISNHNHLAINFMQMR